MNQPQLLYLPELIFLTCYIQVFRMDNMNSFTETDFFFSVFMWVYLRIKCVSIIFWWMTYQAFYTGQLFYLFIRFDSRDECHQPKPILAQVFKEVESNPLSKISPSIFDFSNNTLKEGYKHSWLLHSTLNSLLSHQTAEQLYWDAIWEKHSSHSCFSSTLKNQNRTQKYNRSLSS